MSSRHLYIQKKWWRNQGVFILSFALEILRCISNLQIIWEWMDIRNRSYLTLKKWEAWNILLFLTQKTQGRKEYKTCLDSQELEGIYKLSLTGLTTFEIFANYYVSFYTWEIWILIKVAYQSLILIWGRLSYDWCKPQFFGYQFKALCIKWSPRNRDFTSTANQNYTCWKHITLFGSLHRLWCWIFQTALDLYTDMPLYRWKMFIIRNFS